MKRLLILLLIVAPGLAPEPALGVVISGVQFEPLTESACRWGDPVYVYYDINVDLPEGASVVAIPYSQGSPSPHAVVGSRHFHDPGNDHAALYFTITSESVLVDEVCFRITRGETGSEQILQFFVPVQFHFGANGIWSTTMLPATPSCVMRGQHVDVSFSYRNSTSGDVFIYARPFTNGALTPGYGASGSPNYAPGSGVGTSWFTILGGTDVIVDHVRFQMKSVSTGEILLEFFVPCSYDFRAGSVGSIGFDPAPPYGLLHDERVNVSFEYHTNEAAGVRIFLLPYTDGSPTPNYAVSGSPIYPVGTGTGTGYFRITSGDYTVDHVRFKMTNADQTVTLFEYFVPVAFHYSGDVVRQALLDYPSPAYFTLGDLETMSLPYEVDQPGGILLWAMAMTNGELTPNGIYCPSFELPDGIGSAERYVSVRDVPAIVDQILLLMTDADFTVELMVWRVDVELHFGDQPSVAGAGPIRDTQHAAALFGRFANPLAADGTIRWFLPNAADVGLRLYDIQGRDLGLLLRARQEAGGHSFTIDPARSGLARGVYFLRLDARREDGQGTLRDQRKVVILR